MGRPETVRTWLVMAPLLWRLLAPLRVPTRSQWAVSWLVWPPVKVTEVLVKVDPGLGEAMGAGKELEVVEVELPEVELLFVEVDVLLLVPACMV